MRNETEFKAEVLARFEVKKKERKKRRRILAAALPSLALVLIVSAFFIIKNPNFIADSDDTAIGNEAAAGADGETAKPDIYTIAGDGGFFSPNDATDLNNTVEDDSAALSLLTRTYSQASKIDGFKALLGVWEEIISEQENKAHATGAVITLITEELTEKYILNNNGIYTADMQKCIPLDEKEYEEIRRYLIDNPSDE